MFRSAGVPSLTVLCCHFLTCYHVTVNWCTCTGCIVTMLPCFPLLPCCGTAGAPALAVLSPCCGQLVHLHRLYCCHVAVSWCTCADCIVAMVWSAGSPVLTIVAMFAMLRSAAAPALTIVAMLRSAGAFALTIVAMLRSAGAPALTIVAMLRSAAAHALTIVAMLRSAGAPALTIVAMLRSADGPALIIVAMLRSAGGPRRGGQAMGGAEVQAQHELRQAESRVTLLLRQEHHDQGARQEIRLQVCTAPLWLCVYAMLST